VVVDVVDQCDSDLTDADTLRLISQSNDNVCNITESMSSCLSASPMCVFCKLCMKCLPFCFIVSSCYIKMSSPGGL